MSDMNQLLFLQEDTFNRITKGLTNFKKSPKTRLTKDFVLVKLESLEKLWDLFSETHTNLCKSAKSEVLKETHYWTRDVYEATSEAYMEYKCLLKSALPKDLDTSRSASATGDSQDGKPTGSRYNFAKLPKIVIPTFTGNYSEWSTFRDLFKSLVHDTDMDNSIKMQYLKGLLGGEAEQLVRNMYIAADNYDRCWNTLTERYNNKRFLCNTILARLFSQKSSNSESAAFLKDMLDNTTECLGALKNLGVDVSTWDLIVIYMTSLKLDPETRKQWELRSTDCSGEELPSFKDFQEFLTKRFRALEFVGTGTSSNKSKTVKSFHVAQESNTPVSCKFCEEEHKLVHCKTFAGEEVSARRMFVESKRLCYNCLGDGHSANQCRCRFNCRICRRRHHTLLHINGDDVKATKSEESQDPPKESDSDEAPVVCFSSGNASLSGQVLLATALVKAKTEYGDTRVVRALLDQGSQASFITEATAQLLRLKRTPVKGIISGVGGGQTLASKSMARLNISSMREGFQNVNLTLDVFVLNSITTLLPSKKAVTAEWVSVLPLADPNYHMPSKIDLLLGAEVIGQVMKEGVKKEGSLLAQNTTLGWILSGVAGSNQDRDATNIITMHQVCNEEIEEDYQLKKFWELEADTTSKKHIITEEEKQCEKLFEETTTRDLEGRYIVKLPFREEEPEIKTFNSKRIAEKRLTFLKAKLDKNIDLKEKYKQVLEEYLQLGHMEEIPKEEVSVDKGSYLPHFAVVRDDKDTTKVRIVFDASTKGVDGSSLNDKMMVGPTLQPELRSLLMRWRQHRICLSADIIKMYRQIKVASSDVDYQRILWREDNPQASIWNTNSKSENQKELRLLRVTFGTASAPYLAVKALQQVAIDEGSEYPTAAEKVKQDFYMDDLLTGCQDIESAIQLYNEMNKLLEKGGFTLQKWSSNSEIFLERIREAGQGKEEQNGLELKVDNVVKLLGLAWSREDDAFQYGVSLPPLKEPVTKRRIISDISRLFDPLGWVAPTVIVAKIIIQKLWISGTAWDEKVPSKILEEWLTYRSELPSLSALRIPRWVQTSPENTSVELHGFSDASKLAYAAVVYIRVVDANGEIHVNLVTAKTKVAPIKQVSIPRLELCGAVLTARLLVEVAETLSIEKRNLHAWTDSTVVLAWLNSHPNRWQTFVANRVSEIMTTLDSHQWSHISSKQNPADCASRGVIPSDLIQNTLWLNGPDLLKTKEVKYERMKDEETNLEENNTVHKIHVTTKQETIWDKFSSLGKMIRVIAYCRRILTWKQRNQSKAEGFLTTEELNKALEVCIKICQRENFKDEITSIEKSKDGIFIKLKNPFKALYPYIDDKHLLRVGGRLEMSALSDDRKHPILIPKKSSLTNLLISDAHTKTLHGGPQLMLTYLRSKFWIFGAKGLVKNHVRQCVKCTRYSAETTNQLMGQLPAARVTPTRAFKHSGLDYAGPINIRTSKGRGQHSYKGYICLFVCMCTKAIHIEIVSDMTTEAFLAAFKRFVSRRGFCSDIWSDNGTGFVGASRQLPKMVLAEQATMQRDITASLASNGTRWHFIPPLSPNFGGLWEAGVKSVKFHLKRVVGESTLTYEELATVLGQIEACLNSRPLSRVDTETEGYEALTPGHFLVGEPLITVPDYSFENCNMGSLRRWQLTQRITQDFWRRWSSEYLNSLIQRHKWAFQNPEPQVGDLVLVKEDGLPPSRWLLGRVIGKHPGPDNITRVVSLRTKSNIIKRPTSKLCILPIAT